MPVVRAVVFVKLIVAGGRRGHGIAVVFRRVVAQYVLGAGLQGVKFAYRSGVIELKCMLGGALRAVVMLVFETLQIVLPVGNGVHVVVVGVRIGSLRVGAYAVREGQHAVLHLEKTLVIDASLYREPRVAAVRRHGVAVQSAAVERTGAHRRRRAAAAVIVAPQAERCGDEVQRVYFIARLEASRLEVAAAFAAPLAFNVCRSGRRVLIGHGERAARIAARLAVMVVVIACADGELAHLNRTE